MHPVSFYLVTSLVGLSGLGTFEELTVLAKRLAPDSPPVTRETLAYFFVHDGVMAVAHDGTRIVSAADLSHVPKRNGVSAIITYVVTLPEYENRGFATRLTLMLIEEATRMGKARWIDVQPSTKSPVARHIYEKFGFKGAGEMMRLFLNR
jgi:predicted GNAT family acetyltransferase